MTAINFPANPSNGDTHQGFVYNSSLGVWQSAGAATSFTGLSDTPSTLGTAGQIAKVNSGATALEFADQSGVTVYADVDALPGSGNTGDLAFVTATNRLYLWTGTGWYNIALINTNPTISGVSSSYALATDGTATVITITAVDPEGIPITYSIASDTSGNIATVTQGTGASSNVFTITPSTNDANAGTFSLTFRASDGVNIASSIASFTLQFSVENSNYTTALITSVGANNAVNNSFVDSSTNSHTITAAGNATQTTFSPYRHGGYSTYFDGTGDYLEISNDSSLQMGTEAFTIELWMWLGAFQTGGGQEHLVSLGNYTDGIYVRCTSSSFNTWIAGTNTTYSTAPPQNEWAHVAFTRDSSSDCRFFLNGTQIGSTHSNTANIAQSSVTRIAAGVHAVEAFTGYMTDVRVVKGTAVYTTNFTPPTERLTAITNTQLLACHLPYIADGSTNSHTITVTGNTKTEPFAPYDAQEYAASSHGGSMYFDGTGDYVTVPNHTSFDFGTGDFTIETWINIPDVTSTWLAFISRGYAQDGGWRLYKNTGNNNLRFYYTDSGTTSYVEASSTGLTNNTWRHIAVVRNSSTTTIYVDGVSKGSGTVSTSLNPGSYAVEIGSGVVESSFPITGNMADVRIVKGTAVYTSDFTPPTAPLTAITNTSLLLSGTNAGIIDKAQSAKTLTLNGNVSSSTTQSKYLTSSMYFDGTSDYIYIPNIELGTDDFTIEGWHYLLTRANTRNGIWGNYSSYGAGALGMFAGHSSGTTTAYQVAYNGSAFPGGGLQGGTIVYNQWVHFALVRNSGTMTLYIDGSSVDSMTATASLNGSGSNFVIGTPGDNTQSSMHGYLEDLRVTKGLARYTANFTPPTAELKG